MANISSINGNPIVLQTSGIADLAVTNAKLANNAVTTDKVANKAITLAKLGDDVELEPPDGSIEDVKMSSRSVLMDSLGLRVPSYTVINGSAILPNGGVKSTPNYVIYDQIYVEAGETLIARGEIGGGYAAIAKVVEAGSSYEMVLHGRGAAVNSTYSAKATEAGYYAVSVNVTTTGGTSVVVGRYDLENVYKVYDVLAVRSDSKVYTDESTDYEDVYEGKYAGPSGLSNSNSYVTYGFTMQANGALWFDYTESSYLSVVYYPSKAMTGGVRLRKTGSEDTLPYEASHVNIPKGYYVVVTTTYSDPTFALHVDDYDHIDSLNPSVPLAQKHIEQVLSEVDVSGRRKLRIRYVAGAGPHDSTERVEVFVPTFDGYVMYNFVHTVKPSVNADVWRVYEAAAYTDGMVRRFALTTGGEWEMAVHLAGRDDFSGGFMHGDEIMSAITFIADGAEIDITDIADAVEVTELRVVQASDVYDPDDHETVFAAHGSEHLFDADGLAITQSVEFILDETVSGSYLAMLPAAKTAVSRYYTDSHVTVDNIEYGEHGDTKAVTLLGAGGAMMRFAIEYQRGTSINDFILLLTDNNGGGYHKCYFYANKESAAIPSGTVWKAKTTYQINVGSEG